VTEVVAGQPDTQLQSEAQDEACARWVTFADLAQARGITKLSAAALIRRRGWRRQRDNQGHMIALVPLPWLNPKPDGSPHQPDDEAKTEPDNRAGATASQSLLTDALAALEDVVTGLRDQLRSARYALVGANARAERAEAATLTEREHADELRNRLIGAQAELSLGQERLRSLEQAETERRSWSRWERLWWAWRGE